MEAERGRDRLLTVLVVVQAIDLFLLAPLLTRFAVPAFAITFLGVALVAIALSLVWHNRLAVAAVLAATAAEALAVVLRIARPSALTETLDFVAGLFFFVALVVVLSTVVFAPGRVTVHRILGAIAIYLNVAFAFALAYRLIAALAPDTFSGRIGGNLEHLPVFVYFSLATLTTSAYGDVVPVDPLARSLANLEAVTGQLFPATLLARLVMLELEARRTEP